MPNTKSKQSKQEQNNLRENTEKALSWVKEHYKKENLYLQQYPASDSLGPSVQQPIELYMA